MDVVELRELKKKLDGMAANSSPVLPNIEFESELEPEKTPFNEKTFKLAKGKIIRLLDDFENFYGPKGRGIKVSIHIVKENNADQAIEEFHYDEKTFVEHVVDIGIKGKYEPVVIEE
jgi:hypothetical protein